MTGGPDPDSLDQQQAAIAAYREHLRTLEDRLCDLQLELARERRTGGALGRQIDYHVSQTIALQERHAALQQEVTRLTADLGRAEAEIAALRSSWSWRLTAFLRAAVRSWRGY